MWSAVGLYEAGIKVKPLATQPPESTTARQPVWRTLEEYSADPEFLSRVQREYAEGAEWWLDEPSRRNFLKTMGASFALAGLTGCDVRQPKETILPYVETPEGMIPGKAQHYATAMPQLGGAIGILVESHEGRPTKVEGNPDHPASLGATDIFAQASVLDLYDPHRSRVVQRNNRISDWPEFLAEFLPRIEIHRQKQGAGLSLLTGEILSPSLRAQIQSLLESMPQAKWYQYEPAATPEVAQAAEQAFGTKLQPRYQLADADIILSLGDDFLGEGPSRVRLAREFSARRKVDANGQAKMNRLYVAETTPTITGSKADHWLRLPPEEVAAILAGVAQGLGVNTPALGNLSSKLPEKYKKWVDVLTADLKGAGERGLVMVGATQPVALQVLGHAINNALGSLGKTVTFSPPLGQIEGVTPGTLADLVRDIDADQVETLMILGVDPVYSAPADLEFASRLSRKKVPVAVHYGLHIDATAQLCEWHLPATHFFEEWSDTQSDDGTISIVQPLIRPMYLGRSPHEIINILLNQTAVGTYDTVRGYWLERFGTGNSTNWNRALHDGLVRDTAVAPVAVAFNAAALETLNTQVDLVPATGEFSIVFRTDPCVFDGRFSTNGWLQELPQPISKLTWGSAAWISPKTAEELKIKTRDIIEISRGGTSVQIPVYIQPGMPEKVITLPLGQGRAVHGVAAVGVNVNVIRPSLQPWLTSASVRAVSGKRADLAVTQHHHELLGRDLLRHGTLQEFQKNPSHPSFVQGNHHHAPAHDHDHDHDDGQVDEPNHPHLKVPGSDQPTFYPDMPEIGPQWGLTINLGACTGCNACVVACQSENNVPIVGADQVARGREMHWLRIDSYFEGKPDEQPKVFHQPVMCMHCEHAPCEPVCPVGATTHSDQGLNEMTYNRCIGTRYCSNNCPYKVRRFNFLDYHTEEKLLPVLQLHENPNVSVRSRGVMEKCTYCVQRINSVRINSKMENREIRDGEVVTACQSACPAQAISFGNIADPDSVVSKTKEHPLNYGMLSELNTRPRTTYHAAVSNPNPALIPVKEHA
ncbi:TAT-variant-translocated molybdopterin oxidoreductase [Planctomicrobium sp. SH661]|uniref:TAT-variant-translocated molybdopterin oxidoreductase n=1 Tax=Planctomicrobium sp. SH661 TaxID=3448124 RepID=UPI003F5B37B4